MLSSPWQLCPDAASYDEEAPRYAGTRILVEMEAFVAAGGRSAADGVLQRLELMAKVVDAGVEMGDFLVNLGLAKIEVALCRRQTATNSRTLLSRRLLSEYEHKVEMCPCVSFCDE
jgi:hypothetical protein